jgi:serpin B
MNPFPLSRRKFLTLSGASALAAGFGAALARACPNLELIDPMKPQKEAAAAVNGFAADLYARLAGTEPGALFLSPFSIESALAMTSAGARGKTLEEMEKVLHLPKDPHAAFGALINRLNGGAEEKERSYQLSVANAIWAQKGFPWKKEFIALTREHYGAGLTEVDFTESEAARKRINEWVERQTKQKIKNLIGPGAITRFTRMVLANAIYFKSTWQYRFDKKLTKDAPFTRDDGTKAEVPMMTQRANLNYGETYVGGRCGTPVQILELPYTDRELSMRVFLPEKSGGVEQLALALAQKELAEPDLIPTEVNVFLPRFKAESGFSLKPVLRDMGMKAAFDDADFTGMSPKGKDLFISEVIHKAFVDVDEAGTEAAAATGVIIREIVRAPMQPKVFRADRPFLFTIRENATGTVLFQGRYSGPSK